MYEDPDYMPDLFDGLSPREREAQENAYHRRRVKNPSLGIGFFDYFVVWWDGQKHRQTFRTRAEAQAFCDQMTRELA